MAYTVTKLITRAWYLSQVVSRNLETVSGDQESDGLDLLNALLSFKSSDGGLIPYYTYKQFPTVPNQEKYTPTDTAALENLIEVESLTFNMGPIRFALFDLSRVPYFGSARVDNISTLPSQYHFERTLDGSDLYLYPLPVQVFTMKVMGKYALTNVTLNQDLETVYDNFYIEYLRYALAQMMCNEYGIELQPQVLSMLRSYESRLRQISPADLTSQTLTLFSPHNSADMYLDANVAKGWRP